MEKPDYKTLFADEAAPTVIIVREGVGDVRISEAEFNPSTDTLSPYSHRIPAGYVAPATAPVAQTVGDGAPATAPVAGKAKGGKAANQPAAPAPAQIFTIPKDGKFFRCDANGVILNETPFDTVELAAAAPIVPATT